MKGKKVLLVGLGILGGGVATARFLLKKGAKLRVTDKRDREILNSSIAKLPKEIIYTIGSHKKEDFKWADIVVANPAVPRFGEWIVYAEKLGKIVYNDLTLFLTFFAQEKREYIAVTGTRGKTTSSLWINYFLTDSVLGGNIPEKALLKILGKRGDPFVLETSSFQLEYMTKGLLPPTVALITNLYQDHLNRHGSMEEYARVKANIFLNQTEKDFLIVNNDNESTETFLSLNPKSAVYRVSTKKLRGKQNGLYVFDRAIFFQENGQTVKVAKTPYNTDFENHNLLGAMLASFLYLRGRDQKNNSGIWKHLAGKISKLPQAHMRREVILKKKNLVVVNDSAGTSPEATIALLDSYRAVPKKELYVITGGTDKQLDFKQWANVVADSVLPTNLYFVSGSATEKMKDELQKRTHKGKQSWNEFSNLQSVLEAISQASGAKTILFSPSSASFEKYKNEFDRGRVFERQISKYFK